MPLFKSDNFKIQTPHAAIIVWNYKDRIGSSGVSDLNSVDKTVISTVSCVSIQTNKTKASAAGTFQVVLAPSKNWVSALTAGSWCVILMGNEPITQLSLKKANKNLVKMIGKIETVRVETTADPSDGSRHTRYLVSGTDWGHIFNNVIYIDNLIGSANDPVKQGNGAAVAIREALFGKGNVPKAFAVKDNLSSLLRIAGSTLGGFTKIGDDINRLAKSSYDFQMPQKMVDFFGFIPPTVAGLRSKFINKILHLQTGNLIGSNTYNTRPEAYGYLDPFSLQGTNTFLQILLDNSNPALNEMFNEIQWTTFGPKLTLFNRIRPFSFKLGLPASPLTPRSMFTFLPIHNIDSTTVISVNAGTNWRDKYNFIEIKPNFQDFNIIANWSKTKVQIRDEKAFNREGFRPLIVATKQFPFDLFGKAFAPSQLSGWTKLMKEWYFDTHKLLNGTLVMTGSSEYIAVGNNIRFDAELINPTPNINKASNAIKQNQSILAHVESVSHSFGVNNDGARTYTTTIQFVRGIVVTKGPIPVPYGDGSLDAFASSLTPSDNKNTNTITTSEDDDPDSKVRGT